jgi:hypothetical protein
MSMMQETGHRYREEFAPSVWRNGRVHVSLTQAHIDESMQRSSSHCAGVAAIRAAMRDATFVSVDLATVRFSRNGCRYVTLTPIVLQQFVIRYDRGEPVAPIEFSLRPAFISRAGRKRRHVPEPEQLREVGLRVAEQPHRAPAQPDAVREFVGALTGEAALRDVMKADAPVIRERGAAQDRAAVPGRAAVPRRRPRQARTMVSSAKRGAIPTVLGGRPPPVGALGKRRAYGLRQLRE